MNHAHFRRRLARLAPLLLLVLVACQPENLVTPPRVATQAAAPVPSAGGTAGPDAVVLPTIVAGTPAAEATTAPPDTPANPSITLWVDETSPEHEALLTDMVRRFQESQAIQVDVVQVAPALLPSLMATAVVSNTLPDLVLAPIDYVHGWHEQGILDAAAAGSVLAELGPETFDADSLGWLTTPRAPEQVLALPSDGWKQVLVYRSDWFAARELAPPVSFTNIISGTAAIHDPASLVSGLVVPTEDTLVSTQRVFEQFAAANGCELINRAGEVTFQHPACLDALDYYRDLVNGYSPSDVQTDTSALNAYLEGRTSLIVGTPALLPAIAGLDPANAPRCPDCAAPGDLARRTGVVTRIRGRSPFAREAGYGQVRALGITTAADVASASRFAAFWFGAGYLPWLSLEPERKAPLRLGTRAEPDRYQAAWPALSLTPGGPTVADVYGAAVATELGSGIARTPRWGLPQGQGAVMSRIVEASVVPILLQEMLSGYLTTSRTVLDVSNRVIALIPGYAYDLPATPTPTSE